MRRLLVQFNSSNTTTEQRLSILLELEYLVHQVTQHIHDDVIPQKDFETEVLNSTSTF